MTEIVPFKIFYYKNIFKYSYFLFDQIYYCENRFNITSSRKDLILEISITSRVKNLILIIFFLTI